MSQDKRTQRVTRYTVNKPEDTSSSQGVPTSGVRPPEVRPDSNPVTKFVGDVGAGAKNTVEGYTAIVDPEAWSEEGGEYYNRDLRDKSIVSGGFDTLTGKHTADEFFGEVGWRAQNEPGKLVGEVAVEAPLFFLNPLKVVRGAQAGSKVASSVLKAKLGASAIKAADGPTRGQVVHANKMAKFNKSVGDVNKLNREVDAAATKVRDEDVIIQGNRSYSKTSNVREPRSHVDAYYHNIADQQVSGKNPANWVEGSLYGVTDDVSKGVTPNLDSKLSKKFVNTSNKKLRGYFGEKELFKQASEDSHNIVTYALTRGQTKGPPPKFDVELTKGSLGEITTLKQNKRWNQESVRKFFGTKSDLDMIVPRGQQFYKGDKLLTGAGIGALGVGGLGVFGLGGRKNDKSN